MRGTKRSIDQKISKKGNRIDEASAAPYTGAVTEMECSEGSPVKKQRVTERGVVHRRAKTQ